MRIGLTCPGPSGELEDAWGARPRLTRVAAEKGIPVAPLRAVLARYGEHEEVPEDEIPERLARWAEEFAAARKQLERRTNDRPKRGSPGTAPQTTRGQRPGRGAGSAGRSTTDASRESRQQTAHEEAATPADEARVHRLRLNYTTAADALLRGGEVGGRLRPYQAWHHTLVRRGVNRPRSGIRR